MSNVSRETAENDNTIQRSCFVSSDLCTEHPNANKGCVRKVNQDSLFIRDVKPA